jgi:hypothetical protein
MLATTIKLSPIILMLLGATGGATELRGHQASDANTPNNEVGAILDKAIKAHGGKETLEKFPCVRLKMRVILPGHSPTPKEWDWLFAAPDRLKEVRESYYMNRRRDSVWIVDAGEVFKLQDGIRPQPVSAKLAEAFQDDAHLMQVLRLVPLKDKQFELTKTADIKVEGKPALGLRVHTKGQHDLTLFFDAETGLLVKIQRRVMDTSTLKVVAEERIYQKYQKQDGIPFASAISVTHDGLRDVQIEIIEAKFMQKVEDAEFRRK